MKWNQVYAGVREQHVEFDTGAEADVVSFRMIAEIGGRAFQATHVVLKQNFDEFPQQYGFILDEMVEFIDNAAKAAFS